MEMTPPAPAGAPPTLTRWRWRSSEIKAHLQFKGTKNKERNELAATASHDPRSRLRGRRSGIARQLGAAFMMQRRLLALGCAATTLAESAGISTCLNEAISMLGGAAAARSMRATVWGISFESRFPSLTELMKFLLKHRQPFHQPQFRRSWAHR